MGLFNKKKNKKKEEILIDINFNKADNINGKDIIQNENVDIRKEAVLSDDKLKSSIINTYNMIISKNDRIIHEYYIIKILSRIGLKNMDFNIQLMSIDKNVNRLKKDCFDLSRIINNIKTGLKIETDELNKLYKQVNDLSAFQKGLLNQLNEINNMSYGHLKISTVSVTINKTTEELEKLYNNINEELKTFTSFEEASEYIYYNSGDFIDKLINSIVAWIKETGNIELINTYDRKYFIPSDVVISLDIKEWIDLYNKLKFVIKIISKYRKETLILYKQLFDQFEAKYAILMMRTDNNR